MAPAHVPRRRFFAPEVVQTSAMDCGPAALKCLLEGFGISASYGRLREACQTDVDGSSIDVIEEVAGALGLDAEQIMLPVDHLLLDETGALPAMVVVVQPGGITHFIVVWRRCGRYVQVMDPALGRRWIRSADLLRDVYRHSHPVALDDWHAWVGSDDFLDPLRRRMRNAGCDRDAETLIAESVADSNRRSLATLDAAVRMIEVLVKSGGLSAGREAAAVLRRLIAQSHTDSETAPQLIPEAFWSVRPATPNEDGSERVSLRGAVLLRVRGRRASGAARSASSAESADEIPPEAGLPGRPLGVELVAALNEPRPRPVRDLWKQIVREGRLSLAMLLAALVISAAGLIVEALLLRSGLEVARDLGLVEQRLSAVGGFVILVLALLLVELDITQRLFRLGRSVELRQRLAFLKKLPLLNDRYLQSRPISDMAERSHTTHEIRHLPRLGGELLRRISTLLMTAGAISVFSPPAAPWAWLAAAAAVVVPWIMRSQLIERDLRVRTHAGALSRFYLDALLGLVPVRAHAAERSLAREHEGLLVDWARASYRLVISVTLAETLVMSAGFAFAAVLLWQYLATHAETAGGLLLAYWALQLPLLGSELGLMMAKYPFYRNTLLRLAEPLGAAEDDCRVGLAHQSGQAGAGDVDGAAVVGTAHPTGDRPGLAIAMRGVEVVAAGHRILHDVDLEIEPGEHVAIVGVSGAGKSSLAGLLLGWHRPAGGTLLCDGEPLSGDRLVELRRQTVWIDPAVQLWNASLLDNLNYGADASIPIDLGRAMAGSDLAQVLERLPDGLQTELGENGGLLSAGEGQRVRLARGLCRGPARLVLLDEPFRGLERDRRRELLQNARRRWRDATLVCITHDLDQVAGFDRVIVMKAGSVVETGIPAQLAEREGSQYRRFLEADAVAQESLVKAGSWWRWRLEEGRIVTEGRAP